MSAEDSSHEEAIEQFCGITNANHERAKSLLEACDWNLELAVNMHVDTDDGRNNRPSASTSSANAPLVTIDDSIDEGDEDIVKAVGPSRSEHRGRRAYHNLDDDEVRPPIPPVRQVLVQHPASYTSDMPPRQYARRTVGAPGSGGPLQPPVYDAFRDFQAEAHWQEMAQEGAESSASDSSVSNTRRQRTTLQELFRPPLELIFRGSLVTAREAGEKQNKWLLVNIQNGREFACQILNRDVWSNQTVKDILREHFVFWQIYHDSFEGARYVQFYNVTSFPHVSILDPRTGEQMKSWPTSIDHNSFCDSVIEFLTEHPSPNGSDANTMKKLRVKEELKAEDEDFEVLASSTLYDQSEEAQLEAAIKASLQETENSNSSKATCETVDDDSKRDIEDDKRRRVDGHRMAEYSSEHNDQDKSQPIRKGQMEEELLEQRLLYQIACEKEAIKLNSINKSSNSTNPSSSANCSSQNQNPATECKIALRFPDGTSLMQKFSSHDTLSAVRLFVREEKRITSVIEFVAPPNTKLSESMMTQTLEELGLCPASRLEVKYVQSDWDCMTE